MKYLFLFESYKKSDSILKKFGERLRKEQLDFIEYIRSSVLPGYIGKLVELYVKDLIHYDYDSGDDIKWIIDNIKDTKLDKPIDSYLSIRDIIYAIKLSKTIKLLNRIRKNNSIKYNIDVEKLAGIVIKNGLDLSKIVKLPVHGKVNSDEDFINLISNSFIENMNKHKDWKILYEDNELLIYEILSYEGGLYLSHVNQCIRSESTYNGYKKSGFRFFNIIDKKNINNSIFIDKNKDIRYDVFTWSDNNLGIIKDDKFQSPLTIDNYIKNKIDFFIKNIIKKIEKSK
jgi:hypothetical protein